MGFVSMDPTYIEILQRSGTDEQKKHAARVKPFVLRHHLTLVSNFGSLCCALTNCPRTFPTHLPQVTLLLANSAANEALPLITDQLLPPWAAVVLSVTLVLLFAEILPSSIFTGPSQLRIASNLTPLMWVVIVLFYPFAAPIAALLDYCLGHDHGLRFQRHELKEFIKLHAATSAAAVAGDGGSVNSAPVPLVRSGSSKALGGAGGGYAPLVPPYSVNMGSGSMLRALSDPALSEGGEVPPPVSTGVALTVGGQGGGDAVAVAGSAITRQTSLPNARLMAHARGDTVQPWGSRDGGAAVSRDDLLLSPHSRGGVVYGVHRVQGRDLHANLAHIASRAGQFMSATHEGGLSGAVPPPSPGQGGPFTRSSSTPAARAGSQPTAAMLVLAKNTGSSLKKHTRQRSASGALRGAAHSTPTSNGGILVKDSVYIPAGLAQTGASALRTPLLEGGIYEDLEGGYGGVPELDGIPEGGLEEEDDGETHMESHMLSLDEVTIISSTLDLKDKTVMYRAMPAEKVFMLSTSDVLSAEMVGRPCAVPAVCFHTHCSHLQMKNIVRSTHSRIPVFANGNRNNIVGILFVKLLITVDPDGMCPPAPAPLLSLFIPPPLSLLQMTCP